MTDDEATADSERRAAVEGPVERPVVPPAPKRALACKLVDVAQIVYALQRAERALQHHADVLHDQMGYSGEFPAEDAERMREAVALLTARDATTGSDSVQLPTTADQAAAMVQVGMAWLQQHAPERLKRHNAS